MLGRCKVSCQKASAHCTQEAYTMLCQHYRHIRIAAKCVWSKAEIYQQASWVPLADLLAGLCLALPPCHVENCCDPCLGLFPCSTVQACEIFDMPCACLHDHNCCAYYEQVFHLCERAKHLQCWGPICVQTAPACVFHSTAHRVHSE